jgi:hypothetical protein
MIEREGNEPGLPLLCPTPVPNPRRALAAAEWVWRDKRAFPKNNQELFAAQFVLGQDPGNPAVMDEPVSEASVARGELPAALTEGSAAEVVAQCATIGRESAFQARLRGWLLSE